MVYRPAYVDYTLSSHISSVFAGGQFVCPPNPDGGGGCVVGDLPNPYDCSTYYTCVGCIAYLRPCGTNLHFSAPLRQCVYPWEANCLGKTQLPQRDITYFCRRGPELFSGGSQEIICLHEFHRTQFVVGLLMPNLQTP